MFTFRPKYALLAIVFFVFEVLIAIYVHDSFVRPFVGDYLVVFLVYYFVRAFFTMHYLKVAVAVLLFSYLIETLQYFQFVQRMGLAKYKILAIVMGTSFAWFDILAYTLGFITIILIEYRRGEALKFIPKQGI